MSVFLSTCIHYDLKTQDELTAQSESIPVFVKMYALTGLAWVKLPATRKST